MLPKIKITFEKWKFNKEYGLWVSTEGQILDEFKQPARGKINYSGYLQVWSELAQKMVSIHRLVLKTWRPRKNMEELTVDHRESNKRNNTIKNLIWMPQNVNQAFADYDYQEDQNIQTNSQKRIFANGVLMTLDEIASFIYELPGIPGQYSKKGVREKLEETLRSDKPKKVVFGITLEEIKG